MKSYRMRARDTTLARLVFWNSSVIDTSEYTGPGPLTDTVVAGYTVGGAAGSALPDVVDTTGVEVKIGPVTNGGGPATLDVGAAATGGVVLTADRLDKTYAGA